MKYTTSVTDFKEISEEKREPDVFSPRRKAARPMITKKLKSTTQILDLKSGQVGLPSRLLRGHGAGGGGRGRLSKSRALRLRGPAAAAPGPAHRVSRAKMKNLKKKCQK